VSARSAGPVARRPAAEVLRIAASMTVTCIAGAAILGAVYVGTNHRREQVELAAERRAVTELLALDAGAGLLEVRQYLHPARREVLYRAARFGETEAAAREVTFSLDGTRVGTRERTAGEPVAEGLEPLGRLFVAIRAGAPAGFVVEGSARGYKNRIRFFVALRGDLTIAGVKVVEHEEDPGLGAEVAGEPFRGQYVGRTAEELARLGVTRDPMPEDWRAALLALSHRTTDTEARHRALLPRERRRPIYSVTGATISSRALTDGVRVAIEHFRRRWLLLAPHLGGLT